MTAPLMLLALLAGSQEVSLPSMSSACVAGIRTAIASEVRTIASDCDHGGASRPPRATCQAAHEQKVTMYAAPVSIVTNPDSEPGGADTVQVFVLWPATDMVFSVAGLKRGEVCENVEVEKRMVGPRRANKRGSRVPYHWDLDFVRQGSVLEVSLR